MKDPFEKGFLGEVSPEVTKVVRSRKYLKNTKRIDALISVLIKENKSQGK